MFKKVFNVLGINSPSENRQVEYKVMSQDAFINMIDLHEKWLRGEPGGRAANFNNRWLERIDIADADLRGVSFNTAILENCTIINCRMHNCDFRGAVVRNCNFAHSELQSSEFYRAEVEGTTFAYAMMRNVTFVRSAIRQCNFLHVVGQPKFNQCSR